MSDPIMAHADRQLNSMLAGLLSSIQRVISNRCAGHPPSEQVQAAQAVISDLSAAFRSAAHARPPNNMFPRGVPGLAEITQAADDGEQRRAALLYVSGLLLRSQQQFDEPDSRIIGLSQELRSTAARTAARGPREFAKEDDNAFEPSGSQRRASATARNATTVKNVDAIEQPHRPALSVIQSSSSGLKGNGCESSGTFTIGSGTEAIAWFDVTMLDYEGVRNVKLMLPLSQSDIENRRTHLVASLQLSLHTVITSRPMHTLEKAAYNRTLDVVARELQYRGLVVRTNDDVPRASPSDADIRSGYHYLHSAALPYGLSGSLEASSPGRRARGEMPRMYDPTTSSFKARTLSRQQSFSQPMSMSQQWSSGGKEPFSTAPFFQRHEPSSRRQSYVDTGSVHQDPTSAFARSPEGLTTPSKDAFAELKTVGSGTVFDEWASTRLGDIIHLGHPLESRDFDEHNLDNKTVSWLLVWMRSRNTTIFEQAAADSAVASRYRARGLSIQAAEAWLTTAERTRDDVAAETWYTAGTTGHQKASLSTPAIRLNSVSGQRRTVSFAKNDQGKDLEVPEARVPIARGTPPGPFDQSKADDISLPLSASHPSSDATTPRPETIESLSRQLREMQGMMTKLLERDERNEATVPPSLTPPTNNAPINAHGKQSSTQAEAQVPSKKKRNALGPNEELYNLIMADKNGSVARGGSVQAEAGSDTGEKTEEARTNDMARYIDFIDKGMADAIGDVSYHDPDDLPRPLNSDRKRCEVEMKKTIAEDREGTFAALDAQIRSGDENLNTPAEPKAVGPQEDAVSPQAEQRTGTEAVIEQPVA